MKPDYSDVQEVCVEIMRANKNKWNDKAENIVKSFERQVSRGTLTKAKLKTLRKLLLDAIN